MEKTKETKVTKSIETTPQEPQKNVNKETKYCTLLQQIKVNDEDNVFAYALEKIFIKDIQREEIRFCLYKDMRDRSGMLSNRMLVRPVDLTEMEFIQLFQKAVKEKLFSAEFLVYMKNIVNQK